MPNVPLPDEPDFEQLRKQAKDLKRAVRAGDRNALAEVADRDPQSALADSAPSFPLSAAQLIVARRYGFASWARLKRHVAVIVRYARFPDRAAAVAPEAVGDAFLRRAALSYDDVGPAQWAEARALLARQPEIIEGDVYVASVAADVPALTRVLDADPDAARREGGPYRWEPLYYLAYARHDPSISESAVMGAARLLLAAGADPNVGYLWHGLRTPFTALTGVFGEGEQGPVLQPRHPHSHALARVLLEAGADPNDGQALYNRMFGAGNDHLELLFEFGLGTGDGGPWRRRLGDDVDTPAEMVRANLAWAVTHGMLERVRLFVDHGVDITSALANGRTPTELALTSGQPDVARFLVACGAAPAELVPSDDFVAAALAADRTRVAQLRADHPGLVDSVRAERPGLIAWAATTGRPDVIELLAECGFDVNAKARTDVPSNQPWQTALHHAANEGDVELVRTLLRLGADPDLKDQRFDATALGWARHADQSEIISLLEPLTTPETTTESQPGD